MYSVYIPRKSHMYSTDEEKKWGCLFGFKAVTAYTQILQIEAKFYHELLLTLA